MILIQRAPGVTFTSTLPKLYRDAVINPGTQFVFDALDSQSWVSQAAPAGDNWLNLVEGGSFATVSATTGFADGFVFDADADNIILPASGVLAANQPAFLFICWISNSATLPPTGGSGVAGVALGNSNANSQYYITRKTNGDIEMSFAAPAQYTFTPVTDQVYQLAISAVRNIADTDYDVEYFVDGALVDTAVNGVDTLTQAYQAKFGNLTQGGGWYDDWSGKGYRVVMDYLTGGKTAAEIVALDYAQNSGRFV